jgi:hypothetical protein
MPADVSKHTEKPSTFKKGQIAGAQRDLLEQLFDDHYRYRWRVYKMNFIRGIFFGFGSVVGASLIVAVLIWILSFFTNLNLPLIGNFLHQSETSIEKRAN